MEAKRCAISFVIDSGIKMLNYQIALIYISNFNVEISLSGILDYMMGF